MTSINYTASELGFWFGIGCAQSIILVVLTWVVLNKLLSLLTTKKVDEYAFKHLPDFYKSMNLVYSRKDKTIKATATYMIGDSIHTQSQSRAVDKYDLELQAQNIQLSLMATIAKEHEEWNRHL